MSNAAGLVWKWADETPDAVALREGERSRTFSQLRFEIGGAMAKLAHLGVEPGDRVLIVVPTSEEFVLAYHAVLALGATAVTVNPLCTQRELLHFVEDAGCTCVLGWHESRGPVEAIANTCGLPLWLLEPGCVTAAQERPALADVSTEDAAVLLYTSGTTGSPKGAVLTHGNLLACGAAFADALEVTNADRMGTALPLFHVFGQAAVMFTVYTPGGSMSLLRPFDAAFAAAHGSRSEAHRSRRSPDDVERHAPRRHRRHRRGSEQPAVGLLRRRRSAFQGRPGFPRPLRRDGPRRLRVE